LAARLRSRRWAGMRDAASDSGASEPAGASADASRRAPPLRGALEEITGRISIARSREQIGQF